MANTLAKLTWYLYTSLSLSPQQGTPFVDSAICHVMQGSTKGVGVAREEARSH